MSTCSTDVMQKTSLFEGKLSLLDNGKSRLLVSITTFLLVFWVFV